MEKAVPKRVLVIDDEPTIRMLIREMISDVLPAVECIEAAKAQDAFQIMKEKLPGLIILDIMMEDMNGLQILNVLKSSSNLAIKNVPVIMLSGVGNNEIVMKAKKMGAVDYITKPFEQKIFTLKVKKYLKLK